MDLIMKDMKNDVSKYKASHMDFITSIAMIFILITTIYVVFIEITNIDPSSL